MSREGTETLTYTVGSGPEGDCGQQECAYPCCPVGVWEQ